MMHSVTWVQILKKKKIRQKGKKALTHPVQSESPTRLEKLLSYGLQSCRFEKFRGRQDYLA